MAKKLLVITGCLLLMACPGPPDDPTIHEAAAKPDGAQTRFATSVVLPYDQLGMSTALKELSGKPARVTCITCHASFEPRAGYEMARNIEGVHGGVTVEHGNLTCRSCHNPPRFQDFRMVDGSTVDYAHVMKLCAQCHGSIKRDYDNGAHGGMAGHWDLDSGPRNRNHCLHCHNAHHPAVPQMIPAPAPKYRFFGEQRGEGEHE
jgi:hypothetical protein